MDGSLISGISDQVATLGVIIPLIFLAFQIHGQNIARQATVVESLSKTVADIIAPPTEGPAIGIAIPRSLNSWETASLEDRRRAHCFLLSYFKLTETAWFQMKSGTWNAERRRSWETLAPYDYRTPAVQNVWKPVFPAAPAISGNTWENKSAKSMSGVFPGSSHLT